MKRVFQLLCIIFIFSLSLEAKEHKYAHIGYLTDGMNDIKFKDARIAFSMWIDDLSEKNDILVELLYYETDEKMLNEYRNSKLDYIALNPIFYLKNKELIDSFSKEFWVVDQDNKKPESYIILVRNDSEIRNLKDLKGKVIATRDDHYMGKMYLDAEMLKELHKDSKSMIKAYLNTSKFSTAVLKTFFKTADACIVPEYALDLVAELNPSIKKDMRIVKQSEEIFYPLIAIFHKQANKRLIEGFKKSLYDLKHTVRGKHIFNLFKMKGMHRVTQEDMLPVSKYYENYLELKRDYVK